MRCRYTAGMFRKLQFARFTTRDLLIATTICSLGLALVAWVASTHPNRDGQTIFLRTAAFVIGCSLVSRGLCYPFRTSRGWIVISVTIVITSVLALLEFRFH